MNVRINITYHCRNFLRKTLTLLILIRDRIMLAVPFCFCQCQLHFSQICCKFALQQLWNTIMEQLQPAINVFQLCRPFLNGKTAITFYYQFIFCHLIYGIHIYYNISQKYVSDCFLLLQKHVFRIIANIQHIPFHLISTSDLSSLLNLLTLLFLFKHFTSVSGYRIFRGLSPKYFSDSFRASVNTSFSLRDNLKLHPNNITMLDNIIAYTFNDIPLLIPSSFY